MAAGAYTDQLEAFFRRADLDGDGRISGAEAVAFFQGANLPKPVLAQIWMHADQNKTGFLGRPEFYNALRLVTVAQSKRELTPDIVKAALYGPAAAKIPAPQINLSAISAPQTNHVAGGPAPQMGMGTPPASQSFGFRGPGVPNAAMNQSYFQPQQNQSMRPPQAMPSGMPTSIHSRPQQGVGGGMGGPNVMNSNNWPSGSTGAPPSGPSGISPSMPSSTTQPQHPVSMSSLPTVNDSKSLVASGNGFASNLAFSGDAFSATPQSKPAASRSTYSASSAPTPSAVVPVSSESQSSSKLSALDSLSAFTMQPSGGQFQRPQAPLNPSQQVSAAGSSTFGSPAISVGVGNSSSDNSQPPWPKMKPSDVQKYTKVFMEVDTDRDGKITGEQARNLFLSWRLPREVLKQVWDLSDQDNDSMLSLREFCFSLYLMERHREGRPLPASLPSNVMLDETLLSMTGQPKVGYGNAAWSPHPGFGQHQGMQGSQMMPPATGLKPPIQGNAPQADRSLQPNQRNLRVPGMEGLAPNQLDNGKQDSANSKPQDPNDAGKKVEETENVILDSREKIEFYRTKMQELVLYKSRCDNRLNEITERALADKREAELLAKKYEEKYKQVAEIASKLTIEDATFREVQERKMELHQAITKMEQGGSADGILQVRADRIQYDLEELIKALTERCKKHGIDMKSSAIIELPVGWQPGIHEGAAVWDEDWDKFEDEGFGNDLIIDSSTKPHSASIQREKASPDRSSTPDSSSVADGKSGISFGNGDHAHESESIFTHAEDEHVRSPNGSPAGRTAVESPSREFSDIHYGKNSEADGETHGSFDESTWGAFDNNDDTDSVWGFNPDKGKGLDTEKHRDFFGSDDFGVNPVRTGSPNADTTFHKKSIFFEDSVPSTPASRFGNSPRYSEAGDHYDNFSRFDSFSSRQDSGFSSQPERFTRFDSINSSTRDFGHSRFDSISSSKDFGQSPEQFTRFDSINSTKDFGHSRFDSISSSKDFGQSPEQFTRFDSINSTKDFGQSTYSFDDTDPFGSSGRFKVSSESQNPKKGSDNWNAF